MTLSKSLLVLPLALVAAIAFVGLAGADEAPKSPATTEVKSVDPTAPDSPATKTMSPIHTMMFWVGSQVAPSLETPCPATADGEKAWRTWFGGGADIPLAGLRDRMIADGWTADRFVGFFQQMVKASSCCEEGECECDGECAGKGQCKCECSGSAKTADASGAPTGDATGATKKCGGGCKSKKDAAVEAPAAP